MTVRWLCSFNAKSMTVPDGTAGNVPPGVSRIKGTQGAAPNSFDVVALYDATADELLQTDRFPLPPDFVSFAPCQVHWTANATTGTCAWAVRVAAGAEAAADTPDEHAFAADNVATEAANATEAGRLIVTPVTLTNADSAAAGDSVKLLLARRPANASDTLAVDAEFWHLDLYYNDA